MDLVKLSAELTRDEGKRLSPYRDTKGLLTIGIGRNLDAKGISEDEALYLLANDITEACQLLDANVPWWRQMNEPRQRVLANMCFNMGWGTLSQFKNTLKAMQESRYEDAARGMLDSLWAEQVGARATRLAEMMRTGKEPT